MYIMSRNHQLRIAIVAAIATGLPGAVIAQDKLPEGDAKTLTAKVCSQCHGVDVAVESGHSEAEWKNVVDSMASRGAAATDAEFEMIVKYLAKNFPARK